ncbi:MAG: hypothetical protein K2L89_06325, partial [Muribaculaceae bacterium]|nr:hypothetical protein [Muribaculaceae bacterium]
TVPDQVTLLYTVNKNNLASALTLNKQQVLTALEKLPSDKYVVLLFQTFSKEDENRQNVEVAGLFKAVSGPHPEFTLVKEYSRSILSTDPQRIKEVVDDALSFEGEKRNLFFWGHGMAWTPSFSSHETRANAKESFSFTETGLSSPIVESFGGDNNSVDWADIDEIRDALPDGAFDTIWFDCCYMSNIETIYELRNKCRWMVAYPTEIAARGLPYDLVLPYILDKSYDLKSAAKALFDYYILNKTTVTVTVMDMNKIDALASACRAIYNSGYNTPKEYGLQNYSRTKSSPFYDLGQFAREYAQANDAEELIPALNKALDNLIIYTDASEKGFDYKVIVKENFSGISTHFFKNDESEKENYY